MKLVFQSSVLLILMTALWAQPKHKYASVNTTELEIDSLKLIVNKITRIWLDAYIDTSKIGVALEDYRIESIGLPTLLIDSLNKTIRGSSLQTIDELVDGGEIFTSVKISVKPKSKMSGWYIATGRRDERSGWLYGTPIYLRIKRQGNRLELIDITSFY